MNFGEGLILKKCSFNTTTFQDTKKAATWLWLLSFVFFVLVIVTYVYNTVFTFSKKTRYEEEYYRLKYAALSFKNLILQRMNFYKCALLKKECIDFTQDKEFRKLFSKFKEILPFLEVEEAEAVFYSEAKLDGFGDKYGFYLVQLCLSSRHFKVNLKFTVDFKVIEWKGFAPGYAFLLRNCEAFDLCKPPLIQIDYGVDKGKVRIESTGSVYAVLPRFYVSWLPKQPYVPVGLKRVFELNKDWAEILALAADPSNQALVYRKLSNLKNKAKKWDVEYFEGGASYFLPFGKPSVLSTIVVGGVEAEVSTVAVSLPSINIPEGGFQLPSITIPNYSGILAGMVEGKIYMLFRPLKISGPVGTEKKAPFYHKVSFEPLGAKMIEYDAQKWEARPYRFGAKRGEESVAVSPLKLMGWKELRRRAVFVGYKFLPGRYSWYLENVSGVLAYEKAGVNGVNKKDWLIACKGAVVKGKSKLLGLYVKQEVFFENADIEGDVFCNGDIFGKNLSVLGSLIIERKAKKFDGNIHIKFQKNNSVIGAFSCRFSSMRFK